MTVNETRAWAKSLDNDKAWKLLTLYRDKMLLQGSKDYAWKDLKWLKDSFDKHPEFMKGYCSSQIHRASQWN